MFFVRGGLRPVKSLVRSTCCRANFEKCRADPLRDQEIIAYCRAPIGVLAFEEVAALR
jgi:hypothetical protein